MKTSQILSIQTGRIKEYVSEDGKTKWKSGINKTQIEVPVKINCFGIEGDEQFDLENHGGKDKAILLYSALNYKRWSNEINIDSEKYGLFGENLTISEIDENDVCIGDQYICCEVIFEISQPRQPCWKLEKYLGIPGITAQVIDLNRTGWYARVINPGSISRGDALQLLSRPNPEWNIVRCLDLMFRTKDDIKSIKELVQLDALSESWKKAFSSRIR